MTSERGALTPDQRMSGGTLKDGDAIATAFVKVVVPLLQDESAQLQRVLEKYLGSPLVLDVEIDRSIIGGVWVRLGDTVIDGSLHGRLEALRQHLCAQCRVMLSTGISAIDSELRV